MVDVIDRKEEQFPFREITIRSGNTEAKVVPERGGIVTSFTVDGTEILYLDRATFEDSTKNVRGGIPILFPNAGPLENGPYDLPQHGFARRMPWEVIEQDEKSVTVVLSVNEQTREKYPFDFKLQLKVEVDQEGKLTHTTTITNNGNGPMPTAYGTHPYLVVPEESKSNLQINIDGFDPKTTDWSEEFDKAFKNSGEVKVRVLERDDNPVREVTVISNPGQFQALYVWSLPGEDFFCVEPWTRLDNALNNPDQSLWVQPGESVSLPIYIVAKVD